MRKIIAAFVAMTMLTCGTASAAAKIYKYDSSGRVIEVDYPDGTVVKYTYDKAGNRTQVVVTH